MSSQNKRILILGGSFNPIHKGHIGLCEHLYQQLNTADKQVDEIWFMPAAQNPEKCTSEMEDYEHRLKMCRIQAEQTPDWLKVSDFESRIEAPHYSYRVLSELIKAYPQHDFAWVMGSDNLAGFHDWEFWEEILKMMPVVVVGRSCSNEKAKESVTLDKYPEALHASQSLFSELPNIHMFDLNLDGRATNIRQSIALGFDDPDLDLSVRLYIDKYGLYR